MFFVWSDSMWLNLSGAGSGEIPHSVTCVLSITQSRLMLSRHYQNILHHCSSPNIPFQPVSRTWKPRVLSPVYKSTVPHEIYIYIQYLPSSSSKSSAPLEKSDREASQLAWPVPLLSYRRAAGCAGLKGSHRWAATDVKAGRALLPGDFGRITGCYCAACLLLSSLPWLLEHHFFLFPLSLKKVPNCFPPKPSEVFVDERLSLWCNPLMIKGSFMTSCAFQRRYFGSSMSRSVTLLTPLEK